MAHSPRASPCPGLMGVSMAQWDSMEYTFGLGPSPHPTPSSGAEPDTELHSWLCNGMWQFKVLYCASSGGWRVTWLWARAPKT